MMKMVKKINNDIVELDCPYSDVKIRLKRKDHEHLKKCAKEFNDKLKKSEQGFTISVK